MTTAETPRYEVCSIRGYELDTHAEQTTWWIADRLNGWREVEWFRPRRNLHPVTCRQRAERRCAALNAEHDAWMMAA